jgi:tetratricopeptide (TPR) repeat protein
METMDDAQRARYQAARSLREEGGRLQASGQLQEALERYRKSLELYPDHRLESHIRLIEGVVGGSATRASR